MAADANSQAERKIVAESSSERKQFQAYQRRRKGSGTKSLCRFDPNPPTM